MSMSNCTTVCLIAVPSAAKIGGASRERFSFAMWMQSTGQARSHCLQPMQSSIFTWSRIRVRSMSSSLGMSSGERQRSPGSSSAVYCWVTAGWNRWRKVITIPAATVLTVSQMSRKYLFTNRNPFRRRCGGRR